MSTKNEKFKYFLTALFVALLVAFIGYGLITDCPNTPGIYIKCQL